MTTIIPFPLPLSRIDGVFEGGGALGTAYVGALRYLKDHNFWFNRVAGNSAGAITASMIAAGFTADEIAWLSSAFPTRSPVPTSLARDNINTPIPFKEFLDLPSLANLSRAAKRRSFLWRIIKGEILENIGRITLPVPTRASTVTLCMNAIFDSSLIGQAIGAVPGARNFVRGALNLGLVGLPSTAPRIKDLRLLDTEPARIALADTLVDAVLANSPEMRLMINLIYEGSILEGEIALKTFRELFGKKIHQNANATVLFSQLPIPLAVVAADITQGKMVIYSSHTTPNMEVADAVRQSMSLPFIYQPKISRRRMHIDGGVFSNFPVWLISEFGDAYWNPATIDAGRLKIGFALDGQTFAPDIWGVAAAPSSATVAQNAHDSNIKVMNFLIDKLVASGIPRAAAEASLAQFFTTTLAHEIIGATSYGIMKTEDAVRKIHTKALTQDHKYFEVKIPLAGFDGLDFDINSRNPDELKGMWDRAWKQTSTAFTQAANLFPPNAQFAGVQQSPFV